MVLRRSNVHQHQFDDENAHQIRALSKRGPTAPEVVRQLIREAVLATFGERVSDILLFGSRARGDHRPDSDWDVAVLLKDATAAGPTSRRPATYACTS